MKHGHPQLRFLGATDSVTGSRYLVEAGGKRILVDCGLFQGYKVLRDRNRIPFHVHPRSIDAVLLTHAHLDHSGYIPALVRGGFSGPVYATEGTTELCALLLPDNGHSQEEDAAYARGTGSSRHNPPVPLYTAADAARSLDRFREQGFDTPLQLGGDICATFLPAGHILGAAQLRLEVEQHHVHFTGDLGRKEDPVTFPPRKLGATDVLVTESTYGNRAHSSLDPELQLGEIITRVAQKNGVIMIAAVAVGQAETLLLHLSRLRGKNAIPDLPVYVDSPMAMDASALYQRHRDGHRLKEREYEDMYKTARMARTVAESNVLNLRGGPMVVISGSGTLTGGRIVQHIAKYGSDPKNAIILSGYQTGGTRGAALAAGERELRILGRDIPVRAEVIQVQGLAAHADSDGLIEWMGSAGRRPRMTYITHGEPAASDALRVRIKRELGWRARVPEHLESISLADPR
ncbi:MBL fold metallo-hydrolase RNA specificity domain-containing protein [Arthrobacter sp. ISL-72]|uniref:MBL fold metallo-hydrolase RNA specificity domain-containing protein n=1 Tax=Arthrobacter sp. ISL-72 TaxID=2819114 RepID=UPI001BE80BFB|nr:MBL fold metallo-hydrolase [Arthrobacter sp. ISL-72]MBT2597149.1 MBL fold metallo-hydrolase [Arthrobacter sp. ISL-72]